MKELIQKLRDFAMARDWGQFHSPKNLSMALSVEVAELLEHFQWLTQKESKELNPEKLNMVKEEIGDIMIYLVMLADKFDIDPIEAAKEKIITNGKKYPVKIAKGRADKYKDL
jgi:NTP pyrophosphatase (non-canonical NTP hydrolase)